MYRKKIKQDKGGQILCMSNSGVHWSQWNYASKDALYLHFLDKVSVFVILS